MPSKEESIDRPSSSAPSAIALPKEVESDRQRFTATGKARPIKFDVYDERTKKMERGLGYPALSSGRLTFRRPQEHNQWSDPTRPLHFKKGDVIATIVDRDLEARLAAERGRLAPLWAEYESMLRLRQKNPEAVSNLLLALKEGEALQLETTISEKEMETALKRTVVAPADVEIIEGTRHSVNINPLSGDLFRYYPLSHVRFQVRMPLSAWGPDWTVDLRVNHQAARILKIYSVDLDETNEEWILGIEFKPSRSLLHMSEEFHYLLTTTSPCVERLSRGLALHPPSGALVGRRRTYPSTAPKIPGLLFFSRAENSWVEKDEFIGGVTLAGMDKLLQKVTAYRTRCEEFIREAETELIPSGAMADSDPHLILLKQYHAEAGRFLERASAMTIEAKESGVLVGTLDYQGPLTSEHADLPARVKSPYVEILDVVVGKDVDVQDGDIVFVELPSGSEKLAKVFKVMPETVGAIQDLRGNKLVSVLAHSDEFYLGEESDERPHEISAPAHQCGMPVYVSVPAYFGEAERTRIQSRLQAEFEKQKTQPPPERPLYPIQFTFKNSSLSPLEKLAYMRRSNLPLDKDPAAPGSYPDRLTTAIIEQQDPEIRWVAFQKLIGLKFTKGFGPLVEVAVRGPPDVASASLFHLSAKRRWLELFDVQCRLQEERSSWCEEAREEGESLLFLTYQLLRGLIATPHPQADALTRMVKQGRLDPAFQRRAEDFFFAVIRTEGVNAPASIRILRGEDRSGQLFLPESVLKAAAMRVAKAGDTYLSRVFQRELARRELEGISRNSKYGYGAAFVETGFLFLRDLEQIDALVRSRENYLHDLRFLESSPHWTHTFPLDPEVLSDLGTNRTAPLPVPSVSSSDPGANQFPSFGRDIEFAAFRQLTKPERARMIKDLGAKEDYSTLVLLLRDPFIRRHYAGDVLDWLLLTPAARLELARYYPQSTDPSLLDLIDERHFVVEVLSDIDSTIRRLERTTLTDADLVNSQAGQPISPASIHIYQKLLLHLWERNPDEEARFNALVTWVGLLPSGFELGDRSDSVFSPLQERDVSAEQIDSAIRYVRQRRALKHAVEREREKRAESRKVEIHPGPEEAVLRQVSQDVEAGMPPRQHPLPLLREELERGIANGIPKESVLALRDALRLVEIRDREFATGTRERLRFDDIAAYAARIVFAPLGLLMVVLVIWAGNIVVLLVETLGLRFSLSRSYFASNARNAQQLLDSIQLSLPVKKELSQWIRLLKADELNVDRLGRLQERVKWLMSSQDLVYHVPPPKKNGRHVAIGDQRALRPDFLHPDVTIKVAPCLTLLALLSRTTAERICYESRGSSKDKKRMYFLVEWFLQRSTYFSGYRYALDPLANHHIAASYVWQDIPFIQFRKEWMPFWIVILLLNGLIEIVNAFGYVLLSLPMRFLYLFTPVSWLGAAVFKWCLRRFVIGRGNVLEENLYPDPPALLERTGQRLQSGTRRGTTMPDQPGGRFLFSLRRVATRVLPFVIIVTIVCGAFPLVYEMLTGHDLLSAWNIRSTGIYAGFAALFTLALTMVLHWLPLLMGWIPFAHLRNLNRARLLRRRARGEFLTKDENRTVGRINADEELQKLNFSEAIEALRAERDSEDPVLDMLVLMVENPARLDQYRALACSLVNWQTVVLAYPSNEALDGGGARLAALKTIHETYADIKEQNPSLPDRFDETRSFFMPIGHDCDPLIELPSEIADPVGPPDGESVLLTPFVLAVANAQALMRQSFVYEEREATKRYVGSITAPPQRLYVGRHNVDQGGRFRGGITLLGAYESIEKAGEEDALVIMGNRALIRNSPDQLREIIQRHSDLQQWVDPDNVKKRQLPVAQLVIERFRTSQRYARQINTCIRYIDEIKTLKQQLLAIGPQDETDVSDEEFLKDIAIHYMRHLIVPWFIAFHGGSLENYRSGVLTAGMGVRDRRRTFHKRVLEIVELIHEEGRKAGRQLPKVRFVNAPCGRIHYAKTIADAERLWRNPRLVFPWALPGETKRALPIQRPKPLPVGTQPAPRSERAFPAASIVGRRL